MKLSEIKEILEKNNKIAFQLPDASFVPAHFHVTEIGKVTKHFIDCGGVVRTEEKANFQLWNALDYDHRLHPEKLLNIIALSEKVLGLNNEEIEVEYQAATIGKYNLEYDGTNFQLVPTFTDCLAKDSCGIPAEKLNKPLKELSTSTSCCGPNASCC